ncbi:MAG: hypothetical protein Q9208_004657 [Pyrenodesmia sp. 3 TL-2023]
MSPSSSKNPSKNPFVGLQSEEEVPGSNPSAGLPATDTQSSQPALVDIGMSDIAQSLPALPVAGPTASPTAATGPFASRCKGKGKGKRPADAESHIDNRADIAKQVKPAAQEESQRQAAAQSAAPTLVAAQISTQAPPQQSGAPEAMDVDTAVTTKDEAASPQLDDEAAPPKPIFDYSEIPLKTKWQRCGFSILTKKPCSVLGDAIKDPFDWAAYFMVDASRAGFPALHLSIRISKDPKNRPFDNDAEFDELKFIWRPAMKGRGGSRKFELDEQEQALTPVAAIDRHIQRQEFVILSFASAHPRFIDLNWRQLADILPGRVKRMLKRIFSEEVRVEVILLPESMDVRTHIGYLGSSKFVREWHRTNITITRAKYGPMIVGRHAIHVAKVKERQGKLVNSLFYTAADANEITDTDPLAIADQTQRPQMAETQAQRHAARKARYAFVEKEIRSGCEAIRKNDAAREREEAIRAKPPNQSSVETVVNRRAANKSRRAAKKGSAKDDTPTNDKDKKCEGPTQVRARSPRDVDFSTTV